MDSNDAHVRFGYHQPPDEATKHNHEAVRGILKAAAQDLVDVVPEGRERSVVLTKLEEAMFWANAGVARANVKTGGEA